MACLFAVIFLCLFLTDRAYAETSADTIKSYELKNLRLSFDTTTGQVKAVWKDAQKTTDKVVVLYQDGAPVKTAEVSGTSCDFTETVAENGAGRYTATVYPKKLDENHVIESDDLNITEEKVTKCKNFPNVWTLYYFDGADFSFNEEKGKLYATWMMGEKKATAKIRLYKGSTAVSEWLTADGESLDITNLVASKGSGTYYFKIYPSRLGDTYAFDSLDYDVTTDVLKKLKTTVSNEKKEEESKRVGWYRTTSVSNIWYYYKTPGVLAKREWLTINEKTYHFSSAGIMQIGWQVIDGAYYCFDSQGALYRNTKTPDGFQVNAQGQWILDSGEVASAQGEKEAPAIPTTLKSCNVVISESAKNGVGAVKDATFSAGTGYKIDNITLSSQYEHWKAGVPITVKIRVIATTNYSFDNKVTFSARNCKNVKSVGNNKTRTVTFSYYPKMQLKQPESIYLNDSWELCWKKVEKASRYKVVITEDGEQVLSDDSLTSPKVDISEITLSEDVLTVVKIYAMDKKNSSGYIQTSQAVVIQNLYDYSLTNTLEGELKWGTNTIRYVDGNGDRITGWKQIFGYWYYFKKNGYAAGPGWIKDENGLWYYFDSEHRMCTGKIKDGLQEYFLNDGSVNNLPLGAWVRE